MNVIKQRIIDMNTAIVSYKTTVSIPADSTSELLEIALLGASREQRYSGGVAGTDPLLGTVTMIQLLGITASCGSADWDLSILNINDITRIDTINEIISYKEIEFSFSDYTFNNFFIQNNDAIETNKLYAYIDNNDLVNASGDIEIVLTYKPIYS